MRDSHGRYRSIKEIQELGPDWACGCGKCKFGIVASVPLTGAASLYLERLVQAQDGDLTFCACRAGHMQRQSLRRLYTKTSAAELAIARHNIEGARESMPAPTVHLEPTIAAVKEPVA